MDFKELDERLKHVRKHMDLIGGIWSKFKEKKMDVVG